MTNEKTPTIPDAVVAYATNSSVSLVREVKGGRRNDRRQITQTRAKIQRYLHQLRVNNTVN